MFVPFTLILVGLKLYSVPLKTQTFEPYGTPKISTKVCDRTWYRTRYLRLRRATDCATLPSCDHHVDGIVNLYYASFDCFDVMVTDTLLIRKEQGLVVQN